MSTESQSAAVSLTGRMVRVCMYCAAAYGFMPCAPAMDGKHTHGICPDCQPAALEHNDLLAQIARADVLQLAHIVLLEIPEIPDQAARAAARGCAERRMATFVKPEA